MENIRKAIDILVSKIDSLTKQDDALKFTQAALNLSHVVSTLYHIDKEQEKVKNMKHLIEDAK